MSTAPLDRFYSIIPAGGIGSRLWPLSRADAPKFLHDLTGSGSSLLRGTWDRLAPHLGRRPDHGRRPGAPTARRSRSSCRRSPTTTSCSRASRANPPPRSAWRRRSCATRAGCHRRLVRGRSRHRRRRGVPPGGRAGRSSPRDAGYITTIGITPTEPAIGFGYIHCGGALDIPGAPEALGVESFVEKPDLATAQRVRRRRQAPLERGHVHRSRRPCCSSSSAEIRPAAARGPRGARRRSGTTRDSADPPSTASGRALTKIAIDYTVAEPAAAAGRLAVIPGDFDWDDVGDFASIAKLHSGGRKSDLAILGRERPGALRFLERHRRQPDAAASSRSSACATSSSSTPRRPARDDERERAAGQRASSTR